MAEQRGGAYIEFAIVVPIILFIGFAAIEAASVLRFLEAAQFTSREGAILSFRECSGLLGLSGEENRRGAQDCIQAQAIVASRFFEPLQAPFFRVHLAAGFHDPAAETPIIVESREVSGGTDTLPQPCEGMRISSPSGPVAGTTPGEIPDTEGFVRLYAEGNGTARHMNTPTTYRYLTSADVWVRYRPVMPMIARVLQIDDLCIHDSLIL